VEQVAPTLARLEFELPFSRALDGAGVFAWASPFRQLGRCGCSWIACGSILQCWFPGWVLCASARSGHFLQVCQSTDPRRL